MNYIIKKVKYFFLIVLFVFLIGNAINNSPIHPKGSEKGLMLADNGTLIIDGWDSNNWGWAKSQGYCTGSGSKEDPFIISNLALEKIRIFHSDKYFTIRNCYCSYGIWLEDVDNGVILNNEVNTVNLNEFCHNIIIRDNIIANGYDGISLGGESMFNIKILSNEISNFTKYGIRITGQYQLDIRDINISSNKITNCLYGIYITERKDNLVINNNSIKDCNYGIYIKDTLKYSSISENHVEMNDHGMYFRGYIYDSNITNNYASNNRISGIFGRLTRCTISDNIFKNNSEHGLCFEGSLNTIIKNFIQQNEYGIQIYECEDNVIFKNVFYNNEYGLHLLEYGFDNLIYYNSFIHNNIDAYDFDSEEFPEKWDNGTIGNYWDDYDGEDSDLNNIGDTKYTDLGMGIIDNFPIYNNPEFVLTSPENKTYKEPSIHINLDYNIHLKFKDLVYSLDGHDNVSFSGITDISISELGTHSIQVFGVDFFGYIFQTKIQTFTIEFKYLKFISEGFQDNQWDEQNLLLDDNLYDKTDFLVDRNYVLKDMPQYSYRNAWTYYEEWNPHKRDYGDMYGPFYSPGGLGNTDPWEWGLLSDDNLYLTGEYAVWNFIDFTSYEARLGWEGYKNPGVHDTVYKIKINCEIWIDKFFATDPSPKDLQIRFFYGGANEWSTWKMISSFPIEPFEDNARFTYTMLSNKYNNIYLLNRVKDGQWIEAFEVRMTLPDAFILPYRIWINVDYATIKYYYLNNDLDLYYEYSLFPNSIPESAPINIDIDLKDCTPDIDIYLYNFEQSTWNKFGTTSSWNGEFINFELISDMYRYVGNGGTIQLRFAAHNVVDSVSTADYRLWVDLIEFTNTPVGSGIEIIDDNLGINITFSNIDEAGMSTIEHSEEAPDPPDGFKVAGDYYDITTDATFSGIISLAITYDESQIQGNEEDLKILKWEPYSICWLDITTGIDTVNNIIYGETTDFSIFVVMEFTDHTPPVITIEYLDSDGTDENPGYWNVFAYDDESDINLDTLQIFINGTFVGNEFGTYEIPNSLGEYIIYVEIENNNAIFPLLGSDMASIKIVDDDAEPPEISPLQILDDIYILNISFYVQDAHGVSKIHVYIDDNLTIIFNEVSMETYFEFVISNEWIMAIGTHEILIEIWDADDDRIDDSMSSIIIGFFETSMEEMKQFVIWRIDQLIQEVQASPDDSWRKKNNKATLINKLNELKDMIPENDFEEAYDKLLHDIKPKLTGLKTDENENPWGNGVFKNPWVNSLELQEIFRVSCNEILTDITTLIQALSTMEDLEINTFNNYNMFVVNVNVMGGIYGYNIFLLIGLISISPHFLYFRRKKNN